MNIGENIKVYPFLRQLNYLIQNKNDNYLEPGEMINGVIYFEQAESWGGFYPRDKNGFMKTRIKVTDVFGKHHYKTTFIPKVSLSKAQEYSPAFGMTYENLAMNQPEEQENS